MRELTEIELELVAGGTDTLNGIPISNEPPVVVTPPPDPGPIVIVGPVGGGGSGGDGGSGGGGGGGDGSGGAGSHTDAATALSKIGAQVGIDLSHLGGHSEIFNAAMENLVDNGWSVQFHAGGSVTNYNPSNLSTGTIFINEAYRGNELAILQQLSHEAIHAADRPTVFANSSDLNTYVDYNLNREGLAELRSMQIEDQIRTATGVDIGFSNTPATKNLYQATHDHYVADPTHYSYYTAVHDMGVIYGNYEHTGDGDSYRDYYVKEYNRNSGH